MSNLEVRVSFHLQSRAAGGGEVDLSGTQRVVAVPLGNADTAGGVLSWVNPAGVDIIVAAMLIVPSAQPTDPSCALLVATPSGSQGFFNGYGSASFANPHPFDGGPLGLHAGEALTISSDPGGGSAAGLAGYVIVSWQPAA
jgi:hypothetical protein